MMGGSSSKRNHCSTSVPFLLPIYLFAKELLILSVKYICSEASNNFFNKTKFLKYKFRHGLGHSNV